MNALGPLSAARATVADIVARLRSKPDVGDLIAAVLHDAEDAKAAAVGAAEGATEAAAEAFALVEDLRRKKAHQIDASPRGRQPDPDLIEGFDRQIADAEANLARKRARRDDAVQAAQQARHELDRLREFAAGLDPARVRIAKPPAVPKGATLASVRADLVKIDQEIAEVEVAPLPRSQIIKAIEAEVEALSAKGRPSVDPRRRDGAPARLADELRLSLVGGSLIGDAGASLWAWLLKEQLIARLAELVPENADALTDAQREKRLAELRAARLHLERVEESLIEAQIAEGRTIARRPDASPLAVLGIEIVEGRP